MLQHISHPAFISSPHYHTPCIDPVSYAGLSAHADEEKSLATKPLDSTIFASASPPSQEHTPEARRLDTRSRSGDSPRESKSVPLDGHLPSPVGSEAGKENTAGLAETLGEAGQCAVKLEEVLEGSAAGSFSTCASSVETASTENEGGGCCKFSADTAAFPKPAVVTGSVLVPSEEALHAELETFELLAQLRTLARRWALHQDNFFFHWNCLRSEWKARGAGFPVVTKPEEPKTNTQRVMGAKSPGSADILVVQERSDAAKDLVDTLCSFLPKLWNKNRQIAAGCQNPWVTGLLQQLDARRRATDPSYTPLNRFLSVPSVGAPVARMDALSRQESCRTISSEAKTSEEPEGQRNASFTEYGWRPNPAQARPLQETERQPGVTTEGFSGCGGQPIPALTSSCPHPSARESVTAAFSHSAAVHDATPSLPASPAAAAATRAIRAAAASLSATSIWGGSVCRRDTESLSTSICCKGALRGRETCCSSHMEAPTHSEEPPAQACVCQGSLDRYGPFGAPRCRFSCGSCSSTGSSSRTDRMAFAAWMRRRPRACPGERKVHRCGGPIQRFRLSEFSCQGRDVSPSAAPFCRPRCVCGGSKCPMNGCNIPIPPDDHDPEGRTTFQGLDRQAVLHGTLQEATEGFPLSACREPSRRGPWVAARPLSPILPSRTWPASTVHPPSRYSCNMHQQIHEHDRDTQVVSFAATGHSHHDDAEQQQQLLLHLPARVAPSLVGPTGSPEELLCDGSAPPIEAISSQPDPHSSQDSPYNSGNTEGIEQQDPHIQDVSRPYELQEQTPQDLQAPSFDECAVKWEVTPPPQPVEHGEPQAANGWWMPPSGPKNEMLATDAEIDSAGCRPFIAVPDKQPFGQPQLTSEASKPGGNDEAAPAMLQDGCIVQAAHSLAVPSMNGNGSYEGSSPKAVRKASHIVVEDAGMRLSFVARKGVYYDKRRRLWRANWKENGRIHTKGFSVHDYRSHQAARQKAIEFRERKEQEIEIYHQPRSPRALHDEEWTLKFQHPRAHPPLDNTLAMPGNLLDSGVLDVSGRGQLTDIPGDDSGSSR